MPKPKSDPLLPDQERTHGSFATAKLGGTLGGWDDWSEDKSSFSFNPARQLQRALKRKCWQYVCLASDEILFSCAIVDAGYAANAFFSLTDLTGEGSVIAHRSFMGVPRVTASVAQKPAYGAEARFRTLDTTIALVRPEGSSVYSLDISSTIPGGSGSTDSKLFQLHAFLDSAQAPPPFGVIGELDPQSPVMTQKSSLLSVRGDVRVGDRRWDLSRAFGGLDFTVGSLPRHTKWRWAFGLGLSAAGQRVGLNLANGNNLGGQNENVLWLGDEAYFLESGGSEVEFECDPDRLLEPWKIRSADRTVDLIFTPKALHSEKKNFVLVQSDFAYVSGHYEGTIQDRKFGKVALKGLPGVAENQSILW